MAREKEKDEPEKRKQRKKKARDETTSWERLPLSKSGKQVVILFRVDKELRDRMATAGQWLKDRETMNEGAGIKHNFPGSFCKFCVESSLDAIEGIMNNKTENKQ